MQIERRHRRFYALLGIPKDAQAALGRVRFVASLKTSDLATARVRGALLEAKWRTAIERARKGTGADIEDAAAWYRQQLKDASASERAALENEITDRAMDVAQRIDGVPYDHSEPGEDAEQRPGYRAGLRLIGLATGSLVAFTDHLDAYLAGIKIVAKGKALAKTTIQNFAITFPTVADVSHKSVQAWATKASGSPATVRRQLSELRVYWRYLQAQDAAPENVAPFDKITLPRQVNDKRLPFAVGDVIRLLAEAYNRKDADLADLIELAMWTGARIEELCSLKIEQVDLKANSIEIIDAKTSAGNRQVPVHSLLRPTLARLIGDRKDGFVLAGLPATKYDVRSNSIGKRFSVMKTAMSFDHRFVFHSIRKTVATLLENAGIPEGVAADLLGHEKRTMTYGLYSGGTSLAVMSAAIEKLRY